MGPTDDQTRLLDLLAEHEEAVGDLYAAHSAQLSADKDFWTGLAADEKQHANWVRTLHALLTKGQLTFGASNLRTVSVETSLRFVRERTAAARRGGISPIQALSEARGLENAMIEKGFFAACASDAPEFEATMRPLTLATETHRGKVQQAGPAPRPPHAA